MRWIFFLLLAIGFSFSGFSQQDLVPFKKDQLWGYCDRNGKEVLVPQFHVAFPFYNSYALVFKESESGSGGTWGYISLDGKWIESGPQGVSHSRIPMDVSPNKESWVEVYLADRKGNLTKKFFLLTAPKMVDQQEENSNTNVSNQEAQLKDGKWYYPSVNSSAQLIKENGKRKGRNGVVVGGKFMILNDGKSISLPAKVQPQRGFVHGYLPVMIEPKQEKVAGYVFLSSEYYNVIDVNGKMFFLNPIKYVRVFDEGYFFTGNMRDTLTLRDQNMKVIRTFAASHVLSSNSNGVFLIQNVVNDSVWAYHSKENRIMSSYSFSANGFNGKPLGNRFFSLSFPGKYTLIDITSSVVYQLENAEAIDAADDRYILLKEKEKFRVLDVNADNRKESIWMDKIEFYSEYGIYRWQNEKKSGVRRFTGEELFSFDCTCVRVLPGGLVSMKLPDGTYAYGDVKTGKIFQVKR